MVQFIAYQKALCLPKIHNKKSISSRIVLFASIFFSVESTETSPRLTLQTIIYSLKTLNLHPVLREELFKAEGDIKSQVEVIRRGTESKVGGPQGKPPLGNLSLHCSNSL